MVKTARIPRSRRGVEDWGVAEERDIRPARKNILNRLSGFLKGLVYTLCIALATRN